MNEGQQPKRYYVQLPGYEQGEIWDEAKFNRNKDALFNDHKDAIVLETAPMPADAEIGNNDSYTVHLPNYPEAEVWDGAKLARNREQLLKDHPDVEITRTSPINYWGDKLGEVYDRINTLKTELGKLPAESEGADLRNMDEGDLIAEAGRVSKGKPGLDRRREINRELEQLYRMREENPAWQNYWANVNQGIDDDFARIDQMRAELEKNNPEAAKRYRMASRFAASPQFAAVGAVEAAKSDPEYNSAIESFGAARLMLNDAKKTANAPSRYGGDEKGAMHDFWQGVVDGAPEALSLSQLMRAGLNMHLVDAIKKIQEQEGKNANIIDLTKTDGFDQLGYLNAGEKELVKAFVKKAEVEAGRSELLARSYQAGQSAAQSVGFMADFALFGGIGEKAAEATVGGLVKAAGRNELAKLGAETLYGTVKALAMTPLMPSTYGNFMNNILQFNDAGAIDLSGKAMLRAAGDVIIENVSETVGSKWLDLIGMPLQNVKFPDWAKAMRNSPIAAALKQAGYNGFFEEMSEEWFGNALRVMTGVDKDALKDFATVDQQLVTAGAFAPMSLFGLPMSMVQYNAASKDMKRKGTSLQTIIDATSMSDEAKKAALNVDAYQTPEDFAHHMTDVYRQIVSTGGDAAEAYEAVMEYTRAASQYKVMTGMFEQQRDIDRSRRLVELDNQMGNENWHHAGNNGASFVRTITDQDGNERFVVASDENGLALVDRQGNKSMMSADMLAQGIANGTLSDSGEQYLNDYLDRQTEIQREAKETERMTEEAQQSNAQLIQQAQPGMQVNVGSVESPDIATILGIDGGNYIVQKADGTTKPYTPQEMANFLGIETTPKTDEQIEEEDSAREDQQNLKREVANKNYKGMTFTWGGAPFTFVGVTKNHESQGDNLIATPFDVHARDAQGKDIIIPMSEDDFDVAYQNWMSQNGETGTTSGEEATTNVEEIAVDDDIPRDFRGNPLPMRVNKQTGRQVVDGNALWNRDPEAWARWNDANPNQRVGSKERLEYQIGELNKAIEKDAKSVQKAALKGIDEDEMDKMEAALADKEARRDLLSSILDKYNMPAEAGQTIAAEQRKAQAEQTIQEQQAGFPGIQQKWNNAAKVVGAADEIRLPNGETVSGHYVLTEADAPTPSHNPANGFAMTEGFPVDENGKTVNDRDYERDKTAQQSVVDKAANYDQRALQTPVIVSNDGVVLSGNDRTMASQIAATMNTDGAYTDYLAKYPQKFGFSAEQVGQFQHPRVVFVPDAALPYNAATFAKFNAEEKKSQNKTEKAVKAGKTLTPETLGSLASLVDRFDDINALYNDAEGVNELLNILLSAEIISQEQLAALRDGEKLSGTGMDLLESTLIGAALDEEAVRIAMSDPAIRKSVVSAVAQIIVGNTLAEYNLRAELTDAIQLVAAGKAAKEIKFGESVQSYVRQQHLFQDDVIAEATVQMLADAINDRKTSYLKKTLSIYNSDAADASAGQAELWSGDVLTKEAILRNILEYLGYDTKIIFDTSEREAEQRAAAESAAEAGQPAAPEQNAPTVQSDEGSRITQYDRERAAVLLEQGNVGEIAEHLSDEEIAEFLRLWDEFEPSNDALGQAYTELDADLKSKDKKVKKAAQEKIAQLEAAQAVAFEPVQEYTQGLIDKYGLGDELGMQEESSDAVEAEEEPVEEETADEEAIENEVAEEPKPKKRGKKSGKKEKGTEKEKIVFSGKHSDEELAAVEYTPDEFEELIYGASAFGEYNSKKTGERIEVVYCDDTHPIYHDHQARFWIWQKDAAYGDRAEVVLTTDQLMRYLKLNGFKVNPKCVGKKNKYGYWFNKCGVLMNPIRVELPSVHKGWAQHNYVGFGQKDNGRWIISASFSTTNGSESGPASEIDKGFEKKSEAIKALITAAEAYQSKNYKSNKQPKSYEQRDLENLIRALKTKTLPQALLEEGTLDDAPRIEFTADELDNGVQGSLFGEEEAEGAIAEASVAEEKPKRKRSAKKKVEKQPKAEQDTEASDEETEPQFVLEDEEGTPGNYHWISERICTNPTILTLPGADKKGTVSKVAIAEKEGNWYYATYVVSDGGKGSQWGAVIPSFKSNFIAYPSREAAIKEAVNYIRFILNDKTRKNEAYGETFNETKELLDYLVKMEIQGTVAEEDEKLETREDALRFIKNSLDNFAKSGNYARIVRTIEAYQDFFGDDVASEIDTILADLTANGLSKESKDEMVRRVTDLYNRLASPTPQEYNFVDEHIIVGGIPAPKKTETKAAAPAYGSQNKLVTTDKYEELKRKMKEKLGQLNAGFDPETFFIGAQMAVYHVEAGARKFMDFSRRMIQDLGDAIRPYLKAIYNGARDLPGMEELRKEMDSAADVDAIDVDTIGLNYEDWKNRVKEGDVYGNERVVMVEPDSAGGVGMITTEYLDSNGRSTTSMPRFYEQYFGESAEESPEQEPEQAESPVQEEAEEERLNEGDLVVMKDKKRFGGVLKVVEVHPSGSYDLEYNPTGVLPTIMKNVAADEIVPMVRNHYEDIAALDEEGTPEPVQKEETPIERFARENFSSLSTDLTEEDKERAKELVKFIWSGPGIDRNVTRHGEISEYTSVYTYPSTTNAKFVIDHGQHISFIDGDELYTLDYDGGGAGGRDQKILATRFRTVKKSSTPAKTEQMPNNAGQLGELGKYTHTKTGQEMTIVRLKGDRLSADEFKSLKARAKQLGGYYSSYGNAKGFLFENEEDAIKFNTINDNQNAEEQTDERTAADTTAIISEAASVAVEAQSLANAETQGEQGAEEPSEQKIAEVVDKIDTTLEAIDDQLALLGYYKADQTGPGNEMYGYMKSAEKKAVKDANKLARKLAKDLGIEVGRKQLASANIAPVGGEIQFTLPLPIPKQGTSDYQNLVVNIHLEPDENNSDNLRLREGWSNNLAIMFRIEDTGQMGDARYGQNHFAPYNVRYDELLKSIRFHVKDYVPAVKEQDKESEQPSAPADILQVAKEQAEKSRKSNNKSVSSQEEGDAALGGLFADLYEAQDDSPAEEVNTPAPEQNVKPDEINGFTKGEKVMYTPWQGDTQEATIYDFEYDGRPVLDTGLAPVLYEVVDWEQVKKIESESVNNTDNDNNKQPQGVSGSTGTESEGAEQESARPDRSGEGGREGDLHGRTRTLRTRYDDSVKRNTHNNRISKGEVVYPKTIGARYKANIAAIRLLKELQDSGKKATKEQMAVLRQYTGWGGLGGYFNNEYSPEYRELRSLLTDEEMQAAALSINTAYYTPVDVIDAMWDIAKRLGFEGGNVLEGSAGIGNILASMPKSMSERSEITAVELDNITGGILELLYPDANVQIKGFQDVDIPNGSVDLAITNVPFGDINVYDAKEKDITRKFGGKIHDFCIAKNIRKLSEGGIGIFISTRGTLDNSSKALRQWIVNDGAADVIGAFRLNNATFEGTGATSDIIVVRKRVNNQVSPNAIDVTDTTITRREEYITRDTEWNKNTRMWEPVTGKAVLEMNSYFVEHPENMGGEMGFGFEHNDSYRPGSSALWPTEKIDQNKRLAKWAKQFSSMKEENAPVAASQESAEAEASQTKEGQLVVNSKGDICISRYGKAVPLGVNTQKVKGYSKAQVLADYDALKSAINEALNYQLNNESDEGLKPLLDKLNKAYDRFAKRYDRLNRNTAIAFLRNDVDFPSIAAIEDYKEKKSIDGKVKIEVKKTGIFNGRVLGAKRIPTPSNAKDGVIISINQFGRINIPFIANALNVDEDTVRKEVLSTGLGFENPQTGSIEVEYDYLSGNVREKLEYARAHNTDGRYDKNIEALEKVIPADIPAHLIEFSLGSDWMPVELYTEYAKAKFGVNDNFVPSMVGGSWILPENEWDMNIHTEQNRAAGVHSESLRMDRMGHELMIAAMNNTSVVFSKTFKDIDGTSHTEHDKVATQAATAKMSEMRDDFKEWCRAKMLDTPELAERIAKIYNDTFNAIVPKQIRDTFVPEHFEGMATKLNNGKTLHLRMHQAKAVIRATTEPLMMAHEVGTGKTFTLIATAMEMRRLGTAKKPMIVVQNSTLGQFVSSAKELYPNAKILTISESDRTVEGRSAFYAKIKYNDWDMIVVPQSVFEMIPDSEERQRAFIQEKIDEKKFILEQAKEAKNSAAERQLKKELEDLEYEYQFGEKPPKKGRGTKKDAKKEAEAVENAVAKAKKQLDRRTDDVSDFDDMGIDALLVDEAHSYKHLGFSTAMQRGVKGVDATGSKKAAGVYLKTRSVFDKVGWKNVVFATGTPISNTAAEIWTFMKYLMPADVMRQHHIYYFDDFVRNFGNISQSLEFTTSGKFKENTRFASYTNLPELVRIWWSVCDTVRAVDAVAEGGEKLEDKQPKMEGGKARDIYLPQSPSLVDIMNAVRAKLEWYEGLSGKEKKENSHIPLVMFGIAKMAAIDPRLVDKDAVDEPNSKTNMAVAETLKALKDSEQYKGTCALFCDNFRRWDVNDAGKRIEGFNIFEEIKRKLVDAGVPEDQIVIMKSGMNTAAKEKIFARVNSGEVRVIMGTTATLGTGVNIQERLFFEAHMDAPNRPMDYTQRNGRILRQGNLHKDWNIPVRVVRFGVEDSLDVTAYQRLSTKSKFIDSVMNGAPLIANGMDNRILEEAEEGEFDNPVAVLSGSQYALLKSQAERELRKLKNKKEQHRQDQIYIERTLKDNNSRISYNEKRIDEAKANLTKAKESFPDGKVKEIVVEGRKASTPEQAAAIIKEKITGPIRERVERRRSERGFSNEKLHYTINFDGVPVGVDVEVDRDNEWDEKKREYRTVMRTRVGYSCPRFGIDDNFVPGGYTSIPSIIQEFSDMIATGRYFTDAISNLSNKVERLNADNELMLQRRGKPFADEDKLAQQEKIVADYTEKMKAEMAEKEAKYAEIAKNTTSSFNVDNVDIDDEDDNEEVSAEYADENGNGFFSGIENRRENEDAYSFTNRVVSAILEKYPFLKGKVVITNAALNFTPEKQDKIANGLYDPKTKKILIFAKEIRTSADSIERTLFHESIHLLIDELGWKKDRTFINLFNTSLVLSGLYSQEEYQELYSDYNATYEENNNKAYSDAQIREEIVAHELAQFMLTGTVGGYLSSAREFMPQLADEVEKIINTLGYEPETEISRFDSDAFLGLREQHIRAARQRNAQRRDVGDSGHGTLSQDGRTAEERSNAGSVSDNDREGGDLDEEGVSYELVSDPETIQRLERGEKEHGFRTVVQNEDGSFSSPKASRLGKKGEKSRKTSTFFLKKWERAEENPDLATEDGKINLVDSVGAVDYNPYIHIRPNAINKQFTAAWRSPKQVYIQTAYPKSEQTSGYKAEKAKLSVGRHNWNNGDLILSRWDKPERIVPWEEVADQWEKEFKDTGVTFDIVNPGLLPVLASRGVRILPPKKAAGKIAMDAYNKWRSGVRNRVAYHGSIANFDAFDINHAGEGEGFQSHGFGHYVSLNEDTAVGYAWNNAFEKADREGKIEPDIAQILRNDSFDDYDSMVARYDELLAKKKADNARELAEERAERTPDMPVIRTLEAEQSHLEKYQPLSGVFDGMRNIYTVEIPDDTGDNYIDEMKTLSKAGRRRIAEVVRKQDASLLQTEKYGPNWLPRGLETLASVIEREPYAGMEIRRRLANAFGYDKEASRIMHEAGFVGIKYNGRSDGPCAVIFSNEDMKIVGHERFREAGVDGFISNAEAAVNSITQGKATPEQWLKMIESKGGLKAGEDKWIGLSDWLKASDKKSITKQEVLDYIRSNEIQIEETHYAEDAEKSYAEAIKSYRDEFDELVAEGDEATGSIYTADHRDWAWNQMLERYGDDFGMAFEQDGDSISPTRVWDYELTDAAEYFLDQRREDSDTKGIDSARLDYTTSGLDNKREIALTVPTIDPYNEGDRIHFGDAGEGRAIAWIRFGDAYTSEPNGDKVLVIDEIQSKRHQDAREQGYQIPEGEASKEWLDALHRYEDISREINNKENPTEDDYAKVQAARRDMDAARDKYNVNANAIPAAPFEKNWHELAMKRMLRLAAEEGYDYVAWTTGEQQAERYSLSKVITGIETVQNHDQDETREVYLNQDGAPDIQLTVNKEGEVVKTSRYQDEFKGKKLSDIIGKELAAKTMATETDEVGNAEVVAEGDSLRIGGEGMKGFYDDILPRFMNKYGKKWGVKVEDISLPDIYDEVGHPLVMHSVKVTPEMKESVMQGQMMFREGNSYIPSPVRYSESIGAKRLAVNETATKCGIEIEFRPSAQMQFDGKPLAGRWINGKMYICLEHCRDAADAVRTVLHEGVGHNGLRRLIGDENMTAFCLDMFRRLPVDARTEIANAAITKYGGNIAEATEEYLAERAEVMDFENEDYERNFWDIVVDGLRRVLAKIGIDIPLTQRDVRWLMWQSYNANKQSDVLNEAKRQVVANKLGFTLHQQADKAKAIQIARNRIAQEELAPAARIYNKDVLNWMNRLHETWVDKDDAVHRLVAAIEKATGKKAETFEDIRLALNQQSSKGLAATEKFEREYWEPMQAAIKALMQEKGIALSDVERYVMIKHGLERNEVFAKRDAREYYQDIRDRAVAGIEKAVEDMSVDPSVRDELVAKEDEKLEKHLAAIDAGTDVKYKEFRMQDYGGLTAMYSEWDEIEPFIEGVESEEEYQARVLNARHPKYTYIDSEGREQVDMAATEDAAEKEVADFERGFEKNIDELWNRINGATKATLKHQYDANMISRAQYLNVRDMFKYYVPLRGFSDNTAEDMYDYYQSDQRRDFAPPLLKAKGRKTEAESPFGYIGAMASSGIAADMKNETKLTLYYFVSNRAANDLVSISEVWYKNTGVDELGRRIFTPVYPPFKEDLSSEEAKQAYEEWDKQMQEEAKAGFAFKGGRNLNLHNSVIHIDNSQKDSHIIKFKVGGRDMMMYINGNPRAAQAINNELNVEMSSDYQKVFGKILRWFSGINTSYNPEFWLSNAQRDAFFALMSVNVKDDPEYNKAFRKNFGRLLANTLIPGKKGGAYSLKRKLDSGKLGDEKLDKLYQEFVENGGVTGYTTLKNNEEWELELRKYTGQEKQAVSAVKTAFETVQKFGEAIEQMTRFSAYITAREMGKDIKAAVNDAKELTVNFNRKGSGKAITFKEAARLRTKDGKKLNAVQKAFVVGASWLPVYGRRFIMFFNASVQGLNAMYKLFKKNPGKMGMWTAGYLALGVMQAVIHAMLDDDDDYLDIPDYERRNNLLVGGHGVYFKWALPQEARVFYAMGDMIVNHAMGREPHKNIAGEVLASLSDIAPLNPSGGISALAPSALTPIVEVALNRDYKGAKIFNDLRYLSDEERKRTPAYQRAYQGTGKVYVLLSQFANWLTGGDYADAGWLNINPASVEHILQGATGGAGTTLGKLYRGTVGQALGEDFTVRNTPFLSRILTVNDERYRNAHTTELFDYYKAEAEHTKKLINTYRKNGDDDKLDRLFEKDDYEIMLIYDSYKNMLKYYNDELKEAADKTERKAIMREQDALRKEMIQEISDIGSK